jgi:hypothetical protein
MRFPKKIILFGFVILESIVCIWIAKHAWNLHREKIFDKNVQMVPLKKEYVVSSPSGTLRYFYEPTANTDQQDSPEWLGHTATYTINADALNERHNYEVEKPQRTFRIVTLGDSFTFGQFVNTKDNWSEQLEDMLGRQMQCSNIDTFEVINLAERGYDIEYAAHRFLLRGAKYNPDAVIWLFQSDRWNEVETEIRQELSRTLTDAQRQKEVAKGHLAPEWYLAHKYIVDHYSPEEYSRHEQVIFTTFSQAFAKVLVMVPIFGLEEEFKTRLRRMADTRPQTYFFDTLPDLKTAGGMSIEGHPNEQGHTVIAAALIKYLREHQLLACAEKKTEGAL